MTETTTIGLMIPDCSPILAPLVRRSERQWLQWTLAWLAQ
ncbi:glutathione S-transferase [Escherichia coli]|nr:glutathione S-transferase [Escherichia coli]EFN6670642.1 glutathione S-transferase [Escherichia coli O8:H10]EFN6916623.1 glutathione S-transferase [Escherichia coli O8]OSK79825.1 glutathione S-transferase [Escherichia coli H001]EEV6071747.1 glutathione S-transferase [Escherichia coli]EEW1444149.1 glutathione S-transferase [Escherichia coli]